MTIIKNAVLLPIQRLIGKASIPIPVVLDDASISLVLPIVPDIARRSLSSLPTGGWFQGILENVHSAADDEFSSIDPYAAGVDAVAPYPASISDDFDVWLAGVGGARSSGAGGLTGALLGINPVNHQQGWGRDDAGAPVTGSPMFRIAFFDGLETAAVSSQDPFKTPQGEVWVPVGLRIARGATLTFQSTSAAAAEFQAIFLIGLFPAGLGQDVVA